MFPWGEGRAGELWLCSPGVLGIPLTQPSTNRKGAGILWHPAVACILLYASLLRSTFTPYFATYFQALGTFLSRLLTLTEHSFSPILYWHPAPHCPNLVQLAFGAKPRQRVVDTSSSVGAGGALPRDPPGA